MKCKRCNSIIPDMSQVCPYCGKRFSKSDLEQESTQDADDATDMFDGVSLSMPGEQPDLTPPSRPDMIELDETDAEDSDIPQFVQQSEEPVEEDESVPNGVVETYDSMDDYEPHSLNLRDSNGDSESEEELPELMFQPPEESETGIRRLTETFPDRGLIDNDDLNPPSQVGPKMEKRNWDAYPDRIEPGMHKEDTGPVRKARVRELSQEVIPKKPSNVLSGFMAIILALFMLVKGGTWLLDWFHVFNGDIFKTTIAPWMEKIEFGVVILVVWVIAAIARPLSLKILSLLFAFAATVVCGLVIYLRFIATA